MTARQYMKLTWNAWRKSRTTYRQVKIRVYLYARKTRADQGKNRPFRAGSFLYCRLASAPASAVAEETAVAAAAEEQQDDPQTAVVSASAVASAVAAEEAAVAAAAAGEKQDNPNPAAASVVAAHFVAPASTVCSR